MKANAPEKIYITPNFDRRYFSKKIDVDSVEYIRTDAFIEKACEYLEPILTEYAGFYVGGEILQHFKNYMKGK